MSNDNVVKQTLGLSGRYMIAAVDAETGARRVLADWFDNLITDEGLNQAGTGAVANVCLVGSGSATPTVNDTGLAALVASTATSPSQTSSAQVATSPYYVTSVRTFRFAQGAAAGNLAEVGVGRNGSNGWIFSRALIKDSNGNPTTITVTATEFLDVSYELRIYPPMADSSFNVTIAGVTHACVARTAGFSANSQVWQPLIFFDYGVGNLAAPVVSVHSGGLGTITGYPSGSGASQSANRTPYQNNSLKRTFTGSFPLDSGNFAGGIASVAFAEYVGGYYQVELTPPIAKDATKLLTLTCEVSWARRP
jgi:hypothetical protein